MNAIRFVVDRNSSVAKCIYSHDVFSEKFKPLFMTRSRLTSLLKIFEEEYKSINERINRDNILLTFYDVDDEALTELGKMSDAYKRKMDRIKKKNNIKNERSMRLEYTCDPEYIKNKNKRVTRTKKKLGVVATFSALTLSTVLLLGSVSKANQSIEAYQGTSISYEDDIFDDINKDYNEEVTIEKVPEIVEIEDTPTIEETETINNEEEQEIKEINVDSKVNPFYIETEDLTSSSKYQNAKEKYYSLIEKYSKEYGLDPMVMLAIATQERGVHSNEVENDGGLGLFQVQVEGKWNWDNTNITAFNYSTNSKEKTTITKEKASILENNIKYGCMLFQNTLKEQNYNIPRAIQSYNYGSTYMDDVINECVKETGYSRSELSDPTNLIWTNYRNVIKNGDDKYLENVLRYLPNDTEINFKKPNGEVITMTFENLTYSENITR